MCFAHRQGFLTGANLQHPLSWPAHSPVQVAAEAVLQLPAFATHQNYRAFSWSFLLYFESDTRPKFILGPGSLLVLYVV